MHTRSAVVTTAVAAVVVLVLGACGGGGHGAGVATLAGSHTTTTVKKKSRAAAKQEMQDAALAFARCMREHGVDMPDPTFNDSGGGFSIRQQGPSGGAGAGPDSAAFQAAQAACQPILDRAQQDMPRPSPAEQAKQRDQALKFARCMRQHGIDMPDPTFDDNGNARIQVKTGGPNSGSGGNGSVTDGGSGAAPPAPGDNTKMDAAAKACGAPGGGLDKPNAGS